MSVSVVSGVSDRTGTENYIALRILILFEGCGYWSKECLKIPFLGILDDSKHF